MVSIQSFLQSQEWQRLHESLGRTTTRFKENLVVLHKLPFGKQYAYLPRGPFVESANLKETLDGLKQLSEKNHCLFLRVEPLLEDTQVNREALLSLGFRKIEAVQPEETLLFDLAKSERELLADMEHDTRYAIRAAERRGVNTCVFETAEEKKKHFEEFWSLFEETNKRHELDAYGRRYYEAVASLEGECWSALFVAYLKEKPISGALIIFYKGVATYLFAASAQGFGKYNAPSLLLWKIIQRAKSQRCNTLDLWGVSETKKAWVGLTAFKKSFGGAPFHFVGTWDYVFSKTWYLLYRITKKLSFTP